MSKPSEWDSYIPDPQTSSARPAEGKDWDSYIPDPQGENSVPDALSVPPQHVGREAPLPFALPSYLTRMGTEPYSQDRADQELEDQHLKAIQTPLAAQKLLLDTDPDISQPGPGMEEARAQLQAVIDKHADAMSYRTDEQIKRGWGQRAYDIFGSFNVFSGPAMLTAAKLWRDAGRPGIPESTGEALDTGGKLLGQAMQHPLENVVKSLPLAGSLYRGAEQAASLFQTEESLRTGEPQPQVTDSNDTQPAVVAGQVLSTLERPLAKIATESQKQEYVAKQFEQSRRFRQLQSAGTPPTTFADGTSRILDPATGLWITDPVQEQTTEIDQPDGTKKTVRQRFVVNPMTGEKIQALSPGQVWAAAIRSLNPAENPAEDPSFIDAVQYLALNHGADPKSKSVRLATLGLGMGLDMVGDPANLFTYGEQDANRAALQVERIFKGSFVRSGVDGAEAAAKAKAIGRFAGQVYGRDRLPSEALIGAVLSDPEGMQDFPKMLALREVNAQVATAQARRAEAAVAELAGKAGEEAAKARAFKARQVADRALTDLTDVHARLNFASPDGEAGAVVTKSDVLRTLATGVAAAGDEQAARELVNLGYSWGVSGPTVGIGPFKYELWAAKRQELPGDARRAIQQAGDALTKSGVTPTQVAASAAGAVHDIPMPADVDYQDVMRIADVLHDRHSLAQNEALRKASEIAWQARRTPKELEGVHAAVTYPYRVGEEVARKIIPLADIDPLLPNVTQRGQLVDALSSQILSRVQAGADAPTAVKEGIRAVAADTTLGLHPDRLREVTQEIREGRWSGKLEAALADSAPEQKLREEADRFLTFAFPASRRKQRLAGVVAPPGTLSLSDAQQTTLQRSTQYAFAKALIHGGDEAGAKAWWGQHAGKYISDALGSDHGITPQLDGLKGVLDEGLKAVGDRFGEYKAGLDGMDEGLQTLHAHINNRMQDMIERERSLGIPVREIDEYLPQLVRRQATSGDIHFLEDPSRLLGKKPMFAHTRDPDFYAVSDAVTNPLQLLAHRENAHQLVMQKYEFLNEMARRFGREMKEGEQLTPGRESIARYVEGKLVNYEMPPHVAAAIHRTEDLWSPEKLTGILGDLGALQNYWKTRVTVPQIGFHIRNFLSNQLQMHMAGVDNPVAWTVLGAIVSLSNLAQEKAQRDLIAAVSRGGQYGGSLGKYDRVARSISSRLIALGTKLSERTFQTPSGPVTWGELDRAFRELGAVEHGWIGADVTRDMIRQFDSSPGFTPGRVIARLGQSLDFTGASSLVGPAFAQKKLVTLGEKSAPRAVADTLAQGNINKWILVRMGQQGGKYVENSSRMGVALHAVLKKGMSPQDAAREAERVLFDYAPGSLTRAERVYKAAIPFWTWYRRNIPFQIEQMIQRPGRASRQFKAWRGLEKYYEQRRAELEDQDQYLDASDVPSFAKVQMAARMAYQPLGWDRNGTVFLWQPGLTVNDLNDFNAPNMLGSLTPVVKVPLEYLTGQKLVTLGDPQAVTRGKQVVVTPLQAAVGQKLGFQVSRRDSKIAPGNPEYTMDAGAPYALHVLAPDLEQANTYLPDLVRPGEVPASPAVFPDVRPPQVEDPVLLSPDQQSRAVASRTGLIPGLRGNVQNVGRSVNDAYRGPMKSIKAAQPPPGKVYLPEEPRKRGLLRKAAEAWGRAAGIQPTETE